MDAGVARLVALGVLLVVGCGNDGAGGPRDGSPSDTPLADVPAPDGTSDGPTFDGPAGGEMVDVPAGPFWMGCNEAVDDQCDPDEYPYHEVTLSAFRIDETEVTVEAYAYCVVEGGCAEPGTSTNCNWGVTGRATHPVNCVSWHDARDFCVFAGRRLPTEAEWEKAARGTDERIYPWGNGDPTCSLATHGDCVEHTEPVGSHPSGAGPYGALDTAGNVWEWVGDWYDENYYASSPSTDPRGPATGSSRSIRGGAVGFVPSNLRTSERAGFDPTIRQAAVIGFRCASNP